MAKPVKTLELHYPMIQFLTTSYISRLLHGIKFVVVLSKHLWIFLESLWQCSVIFENLRLSSNRKFSGNIRVAFGKWSEVFENSSELRHQYVYIMDSIIRHGCLSVDKAYLFTARVPATLYFTRSLCSLVRYRVEHSKRYVISIHAPMYLCIFPVEVYYRLILS